MASKKQYKKFLQSESMTAYVMFADGKSYSEIIARTGMPANVVRTRIKRGKILFEQRVLGHADTAIEKLTPSPKWRIA